MQRFTYDAEASATYIYINEALQFSRTITVHEDEDTFINIDVDADDRVIGIEIIA
jgi:uncharacterized protein YuzE